MGEHPGTTALIGGAIVLSAVIVNEVVAALRTRAPAPPAGVPPLGVNLPDFPPLFYPVAIFAILLTGIAKSGFGGGAAGIAVPLMSIFIAPPEAAAIMLPILCAMDLFGVHAYRGRWSREHLAILLPGALVGIVVGAFAFGAMSVDAIRLLVGGIAVVFALNRWFRLSERLATRLARVAAAAGTRRRRVLGRGVGIHEHARARRRPAVRHLHAAAPPRQDDVRRDVGRVLPDRQLREARAVLLPRAAQRRQPRDLAPVRAARPDRRLARRLAAPAPVGDARSTR